MHLWNKSVKWISGLLLAGLIFVIFIITTESSSVVDWTRQRAVVLESDDWGLAGFVPSAEVWHGHQRENLVPGNFPGVYWESTLEDSTMVAGLCSIMAEARGADGLPAVFQPNYVVSSLSFENEDNRWLWKRYNLPDFPPAYQRKGMWSAVKQGIEAGVWYPEFHATWHYDPAMRFEHALETGFSKKMTKAGVMLFPKSEKARELGPWRSVADLRAELQESRKIFRKVFNRPIGAIIAPDYTWDDRVEKMWLDAGISVIQAKREQRDPTLGNGGIGRILKFLKRKLTLAVPDQRVYLERNCRLEPVQALSPDIVTLACVKDTRAAWKSGQPAIVETHRINYAHDDPKIVRQGQDSLKQYLETLCATAENLPTFMVDTEIAQLQRQGVSWVVRGNQLILRNATHSRRLIVVNHDGVTRWFALASDSFLVTPWG